MGKTSRFRTKWMSASVVWRQTIGQQRSKSMTWYTGHPTFCKYGDGTTDGVCAGNLNWQSPGRKRRGPGNPHEWRHVAPAGESGGSQAVSLEARHYVVTRRKPTGLLPNTGERINNLKDCWAITSRVANHCSQHVKKWLSMTVFLLKQLLRNAGFATGFNSSPRLRQR